MSVAAPLVLRDGDRSRLEALLRTSSVRSGPARRARIVLLAADGVPNAEIARLTGTSRPTVLDWRDRYVAGGITACHAAMPLYTEPIIPCRLLTLTARMGPI